MTAEVYVCHMGTTIMAMGEKADCQAYKDAQPFRTDSWKISSLEAYGEACYSDGFDSGYDSGRDDG